MQVYGSSYVHGPQSISAPHTSRGAAARIDRSPLSPTDEVQISTTAQLIDRVRELPDIRADRVAQLRAEIAAGSYDTPERFDAAFSRLLDEIG